MELKKDFIYPITLKIKFFAPYRIDFWSVSFMSLWIGLWGFGLVWEYLQSRVNFVFFIALIAWILIIIGFIYSIKRFKPIIILDSNGIEFNYKYFKDILIPFKDLDNIELKSRRRDSGGNRIELDNQLLIHLKRKINSTNLIKLPLGITYYAFHSEQKRLEKIKNKLQKYPIKLINFDYDIDSQNKNYSVDEDIEEENL